MLPFGAPNADKRVGELAISLVYVEVVLKVAGREEAHLGLHISLASLEVIFALLLQNAGC